MDERYDGQDEMMAYFESLVMKVNLSKTMRRLLFKEFQQAGLSKRISMVSELEETIPEEPEETPDEQEEEEEKGQDESNQHIELNPLEEQVSSSDIDKAWEDLLERSLDAPKRDLLRQSYYKKDKQDRFHMYLEFASYLRPISKAGMEFRKKMGKSKENDLMSNMIQEKSARSSSNFSISACFFVALLSLRMFGSSFF